MKKKGVLICLIMLLSAFLLQGCEMMEGETSKLVEVDEERNRIKITLKSDTSENYEWVYFFEDGYLEENANDMKSNVFNDTYTEKYAFVTQEERADTLYLVLYKTGNVDGGKLFQYDISYNSEGDIQYEDKGSCTLANYPDLLKKAQEAVAAKQK